MIVSNLKSYIPLQSRYIRYESVKEEKVEILMKCNKKI